MMRLVNLLAGLLFCVLQYQLWFAEGGVPTVWHMKQQVKVQEENNHRLQTANSVLVANIQDLKNGNQAIEEQARNDLGMIKTGEVFYQVANN